MDSTINVKFMSETEFFYEDLFDFFFISVGFLLIYIKGLWKRYYILGEIIKDFVFFMM